MKKILLATMAVMSISALASNNVYIKLGGDAYTHYDKVSLTTQPDNKTIDIISPEKGRGVGGFVEATTDLTPEFEVGLGAGFIGRYNGANEIIDSERYEVNKPRYSSIPVYATAKFNIANDSEITPYVKADIGYSFNKVNGDFKQTEVGKNTTATYNTKVANGLYGGLGIGAEYKNFLAEVSYNYINSTITLTPEKEKDAKGEAKSYGNKAVRVSLGYKFNF